MAESASLSARWKRRTRNERGRDGGCYRFRARPRHRRRYRNGWVIDLRSGATGKFDIGKEAGKSGAEGEQRDRPRQKTAEIERAQGIAQVGPSGRRAVWRLSVSRLPR